MSLDVAYSYSIKLTDLEKIDISKKVRKNRFELRFAIFFPFLLFPMVDPIGEKLRFTSTATSIEKLIPNQLQTNQQELLLDLRGGHNDLFEVIIRILLVWTISKNSKPTEGFQPKPIIVNISDVKSIYNRTHELPQNYKKTQFIEIIWDREIPDQSTILLLIN